jgi:hypothetical protein
MIEIEKLTEIIVGSYNALMEWSHPSAQINYRFTWNLTWLDL